METLAGALQKAHEQGVVHRDLNRPTYCSMPAACRRLVTSAWRKPMTPR